MEKGPLCGQDNGLPSGIKRDIIYYSCTIYSIVPNVISV